MAEILHSVANLISTPYTAPAGVVVQGATASVEYVQQALVDKDVFTAVLVTQAQVAAQLADVAIDVDFAAAAALLQAQNFTGKASSTAFVATAAGQPVILVGLGDKPKAATLRAAVRVVTKQAIAQKRAKVQVVLPTVAIPVLAGIPLGYGQGVKASQANHEEEVALTQAELLNEVVRALFYDNWKHDLYLKEKYNAIRAFVLVGAGEVDIAAIHRAVHGAESLTFAREIGSLRMAVANNIYCKDQAVALQQAHSDVLSIKVLDKEELKKEQLNLILAVNQGSTIPPFIVALEYTPPNYVDTGKAPYAYVGKNLTFDTGGYDLKPAAGMFEMHIDKLGGCNTLSLMRYLALTRPATTRKVVGVMTITDNEIGPDAVHPNTIIQTPKGSVLIGNTDAEGRLALADAVQFVQKYYKPARITTMATLTGAIMIALGHTATGVFTNVPQAAEQLKRQGDLHGDNFWPMPVYQNNYDDMKPIEADLNNITGDRLMGSSVAAAFIDTFVDEGIEFVHLDIAGSSTDRQGLPTGASLPTLQAVTEQL